MRNAIIFGLCWVFLVVHFANAGCHNDCSHNGDCEPGTGDCICYKNYYGEDCSIFTQEMPPFEVTNVTAKYSWKYYRFKIKEGDVAVEIILEQKKASEDCDVFVRHNNLPDRRTSDIKNESYDIISRIALDNPAEGFWYIGIYSWTEQCEYTLSVRITGASDCANPCVSGTCQNSVCECYPDYAGEDCSIHLSPLTAGTRMQSLRVRDGESDYYRFLSDGTPFSVDIVEDRTATPNGDCDVSIRFNELPENWIFDYADWGNNAEFNITVSEPEHGTYYIRVRGFSTTVYSISLNLEGGCPLRCSDHGSCSNNKCFCNSQFEGEECETMNFELPVGKWQKGYVDHQSWNYYHITPNTQDNMIIIVEQTGHDESADCDIYVKSGQNPTFFIFDDYDIGGSTTSTLIIENPQGKTWHIGIWGFHACEYRISVAYESNTCPNSCSRKGNCVDGRCQCNNGWGGLDCNSPLITLENKEVQTNEVAANQWDYFKVTVGNNSASLLVDVYETHTVGKLWLYIMQGTLPTVMEYGWKDDDTGLKLHSIYFQRDLEKSDHVFYVGVYGSPYARGQSGSDPQQIQYSIVAYSPNL